MARRSVSAGFVGVVVYVGVDISIAATVQGSVLCACMWAGRRPPNLGQTAESGPQSACAALPWTEQLCCGSTFSVLPGLTAAAFLDSLQCLKQKLSLLGLHGAVARCQV